MAQTLYDWNDPGMRDAERQFWSNLLSFSDTYHCCISLNTLRIELILG